LSHYRHSEPGLAVEVHAYSGGRDEEEPRCVVIGGARLEVREILSRSQQPSGRFFRVATSDGEVHELFCRDSDGSWWLVAGEHPLR
jgi:hypothetical protein